MIRTARRAAVATLTALAAIAAIIAADLTPPASAQSEEETAGRIVARLLDDGRVEFGWQPTGGARVLPTQRYFPTDATVDRWLRSSPVEVNGAEIGRINARLLEDGRIEFAFTPTDRERILTDARYFPTSARPNRWLRSTEITINGFIAVSAGVLYTCGLRESGAIECWGISEGDEYYTGQTDAPAGSFTAIITTTNSPCAIRDTGALACWGDGTYGQTDTPAGSYAAVSVGGVHTCAIRTDGEIECWGASGVVDEDENTGEEEVFFEYGLIDAPEGSFTAVSAGDHYTCAIAETFEATGSAAGTGEIECWGVGEGDQHYNGQTDAPTGRFTAISTAGDYTCAIRASREIACWGSNTHAKTDAPDGRFTAISIARSYACGLRETGEIACWGLNWGQEQIETPAGPMGFTAGTTDAPAGTFTAVSANTLHACAIRADTGELECWGTQTLTDSPDGSFTAVSAGWSHTCAIRESTDAIECWGGNQYGQAAPPSN